MNIISLFLKLIAPELIQVDDIKFLLDYIIIEAKQRKLLPEELKIKEKLSKVYEAAKVNKWSQIELKFKNSTWVQSLSKGLGKITDSGKTVPGGAVDVHWSSSTGKKPSEVIPDNLTGKKGFIQLFKKMIGYFDSDKVREYCKLKGIEWGNWMTQKDRAEHLIAMSLSWPDLKAILKPSSYKLLSLNSKLNVAFGARGVKGSAAHYRPKLNYINLNKDTGNRSFLHEWAHAFDFIVFEESKIDLDINAMALSGPDSTSFKIDKERLNSKFLINHLFEKLFETLYWNSNGNESSYQKRLGEFKGKQGRYYRDRAEVWARLLEVFVYDELKSKNIINTYLVKSKYSGKHYVSIKEVNKVKSLVRKILKEGFQILKSGKPTEIKPLGGVIEETTKAVKKVKDTVKAVKMVSNVIKELPKELQDIVKPIGELTKVEFPTFNIPGDIGGFLGNIEKKPNGSVVVTLDGEAGAGKTRFVFQLINALALGGSKGLFISSEEDPESSLFRSKRDLYLDDKSLSNIDTIAKISSLEQIIELLEYYDWVVIDSWSKIPNGRGRLDELRNAINGKLIVSIFQQTQDGKMRGGSDAEFDADVILKMFKDSNFMKSYVWPYKNRYQDKPLSELAYNIYERKLFNPEKVED